MLDWLIDLAFGSLYGALVTVIALVAAVPYGIWQGLKAIGRRLGGSHGND